MSPWESFFSCRISRRRSPIIMGHYCISVWLEQVLHTQPRTRGKIEVCATTTREPDPGSPDRDASTTINFKRDICSQQKAPVTVTELECQLFALLDRFLREYLSQERPFYSGRRNFRKSVSTSSTRVLCFLMDPFSIQVGE